MYQALLTSLHYKQRKAGRGVGTMQLLNGTIASYSVLVPRPAPISVALTKEWRSFVCATENGVGLGTRSTMTNFTNDFGDGL